MMMNNRNRSKLDAYQRVIAFNQKYAAILSTIDEYVHEQKTFGQAVLLIINASGLQNSTGGSSTEHIYYSKQAMGKTVIKFAVRAKVKASHLNNINLADSLNHPLYYITGAPKQTSVERAMQIRNVVNDHLADLTNISTADIAEMDTAIDIYNTSKDEPTIKKKVSKASGTDVLPQTFTDADKAVENMFGLLHSYFAETNAVMVREMQLAMDVTVTGIRHTSLVITVLADNTGLPLTGATMVNNNTQKIYTADAMGEIHIDSHRGGHHQFVISATGKQPLTVTFHIIQSKENSFTVRLKD